MLHTFDGPCHMKIEKYMKNLIAITFYHVFIIFHVAESIETVQHGYSLDEELNFTFHEYSRSKFE